MPRLYTSESEPMDFCKRCYPSEKTAWARYGHDGDGPDGRGNCFDYDSEHPPYDDPGWEYNCDKCGKKLTPRDD